MRQPQQRHQVAVSDASAAAEIQPAEVPERRAGTKNDDGSTSKGHYGPPEAREVCRVLEANIG